MLFNKKEKTLNKEIINGAIKITNDSFYLVDENVIKAYSPYALIIALNEMFKVNIDPIHSKVSATSRSVVRVAEDTQWQEAGFGYKGLFAFLKDILNVPIDTDKSFARTTNCWYVYLQDSYKEAFNKMLDSEGKEGDNNQTVKSTSDIGYVILPSDKDSEGKLIYSFNAETQEIINNKEVNTNEKDAGQEKAESSTRNEPDCDEAGVQQDQEGTQDESGASDVPADPAGIDGVQGLSTTGAVEEPKPKQTRQRKPKKA